MGKITLITGGARSGKSSFAEEMAKKRGGKLIYVATGQPLDKEMQDRIRKHKKRRGNLWKTIEEPIEIKKILRKISSGTIVLDCVTLWINNLIEKGLGDTDIKKNILAVLKIAGDSRFSIIIVTNEVGCGIVPENKLARRYRDILGVVNQLIAKKANSVYWMCNGIPLEVKHAKNK